MPRDRNFPPPVVDDFTRGNSTGLASRVNEMTWSSVVAIADLNISSNRVVPSSGANCEAQTDRLYGPAMFWQFTLATKSASSSFSDFIGCRFLANDLGGAGEDSYRFFFDCGSEFWIQRFNDAAASTVLAQSGRTLASGDKIGMEVIKLSDRMRFLIYKNGILSDAVDDTAAGRIVVAGQFALECGATVTDWAVDDLCIEDIPTAFVPRFEAI